MRSLARSRSEELKRVLQICKDFEPGVWGTIINNYLKEDYLPEWYAGLYVDAGLPQARSVTRDLTRGKASDPIGIWEIMLRDYALKRAGENIVIVSGTLKDALQGIVAGLLDEDENIGIEKLARSITSKFNGGLNLWQCRRIAQTETMIGLAEASHEAAVSLDIRYTKEWCCSGLTNTRDTHQDMDGVVVDEDELFVLEDCTMLYPHDNSTDPPASEIINCACSCIRLPK